MKLMLGQLYTLRGTSDFYQESSPGQVTDFFVFEPWLSVDTLDSFHTRKNYPVNYSIFFIRSLLFTWDYLLIVFKPHYIIKIP